MPKDPCSELAKTITELALNIGARPDVHSLNDVTVELQRLLPEMNLTREEVVRSIIEATEGYREARSELAKKLVSLKQEARTDRDLREAVTAMQGHLAQNTQPPKPARGKPVPKEIAALRAELGTLKEQVKTNSPEARAKIRARIDELERHIAAGTVPPTQAKKVVPADIAALRDERAAKRKQMMRADPARRKELADQIGVLNKHIAEGTHPAKAPPKASDTPADVRTLREQRDDLRRQLDRDSPEALAKIQSRIDELEGHLKAGTLPPKTPKVDDTPEAVAALQAARDSVLRALAKSEPAIRQKFEKQIADLTSRLEDGVSLPGPKVEPVLSKELERLAYERDRLRARLNQHIRGMKPKGFWGHVAEPINLARSIMTSMDLSAVLRQGGFIAIGNPARAAKSIVPMFRALGSKYQTHRINDAILNRPNAPMYARAKLYLAPEGTTTLSKQEEAFMSRLAEKIPLVAGSQRAYSTFLNKLRADSFDAMVATLARNGEPTLEEMSAIANYINVATGRAHLGKLEGAAPALNTIFFAPRYVYSRFQLIAGAPVYGGTWRTRKLIAAEYGKLLTGLGVVYALGSLAGGEIEEDPRSSDFGKIRFGDTRLDPLMGISQVTRLVARTVSGEKKQLDGKVVSIRGDKRKFGSDGVADNIEDFLRSKLAPFPGAVLDTLTGENVVHEPVTPGEAALGLFTPLSFGEIYQTMEAEGVPKGTALGILSIFGMGLQHHEKRQKED